MTRPRGLPPLIASCLVILLLASSGVMAARAQPYEVRYPWMTSPRSFEDCDRFQEAWDKLAPEIDEWHQKCLEDSEKAGLPKDPRAAAWSSGSKDAPICTYPRCQSLHTLRVNFYREQARRVAQCRQEVKDYLATLKGCIPGCKRWNSQRGLAGEPVCEAMVYCPADRTSPPGELDRAPVAPRPR